MHAARRPATKPPRWRAYQPQTNPVTVRRVAPRPAPKSTPAAKGSRGHR